MATNSNGVNRPTNPGQRDQDIANKLQLYGIYSAFANGKVPSNKQIDVALNSFLESRALKTPSGRLSEEGRKLVGDVREVIEQAKLLLLTKNEGNLLQDFVWQTQQISGANATTPNAPVDKDQAKQHGQQALDGLRTLGTLLITNGQFRKLLNDAVVLLRSVAGDAASKAATKVQPSEDSLNQIDRPAEDNTWHEAPNLSKDNLKAQAKETFNKNKPVDSNELRKAAGDATQAAHPTGSRDPADAANLAAENRGVSGSGLNPVAGAQAGIDTLRQQASENVSEDTKDTARAYKERTKSYISEKMPQERRDQTIWRLKKMVVEIQGHQDYQQAIETLLNLAETYAGHGRDVAGQSVGTVKDAHGDSALQTAEKDLKTLLERFANSTSSDDLFDSINQIYRDADQDPELKNWFKSVDAYIRRCLQEQGYIMQDASTEQYNRLYDQGEFLLRNKYRGHTDRILDEFKFLGNQFDADPQNRRFADSVQKLFLDLGNDENGKATFKPHLLKDFSEVIIPAVLENVSYVPIPRIEYSDPQVDLVVENLIVESDNLAPNVLEFSSDNHWKWGRKQIANKNKNKIMLAVSGVQMDLRDVAFYVKRKQGFPSITDKGVCDIFMGGTGLSFKIAAETADPKDRVHFFKIGKVDVDMKNVNIKMKKSSHKLLFALAKPILLKVLRPVVQKVIEKQIKDAAYKLDALAWSINQEAIRVKEEAARNPDPDHIQNMYERYLTAAKTKVLEGKKKTKEATEDKKVNVAVTQQDSMFPNIQLPGGVSTKATEYKELAAKGDKWESPVFGIGSAKETTNLPKIESVTRKPHDTATPRANIGSVHSSGTLTASGYADNNNLNAQSVGTGYSANPAMGTGYSSNGFATGTNDGYSASKLGTQMDNAFAQQTQPINGGVLNGNTIKSDTAVIGQPPIQTA